MNGKYLITSCSEPMSENPAKGYLVPMVVERSPQGERAYDIFSRLLQDRIILLNSAIDANVAGVINAQLLYLTSDDASKDIHLYITSPGGGVQAGLSILDTMKFIQAPVVTYCQGVCASMAAILLAAGDRRCIMPNAEVMIHQPLGGVQGQASEIETAAKHILYLKKRLNQMLADFSGQKLAKIEKDTDRDFWMTAEEAIKYGLVDEIIPWTEKDMTPAKPDDQE